ncbi:hypothetical protein Nepgr_002630 [Nepenthes gracilis]|uniref:NADH dehydrogenase subunit 6 n=1 Tax=Nepenthes gracilis TaxID=150966 RepID=A0AAD3P6L4_NEPGR|nr:hypothetical protein Nepgr_002630 [Nepenthes gracilis]
MIFCCFDCLLVTTSFAGGFCRSWDVCCASSCSGTRIPAPLAAIAFVLILLLGPMRRQLSDVVGSIICLGLAATCARFLGGYDPISSGLVRVYIMVVELLYLGEVAIATLAVLCLFSVELLVLSHGLQLDSWSDAAGAWGPLGLVTGQHPSTGFCCVSLQLEQGYGWSSIVINFCPTLLDVLPLTCLPWSIVAAVWRGCMICWLLPSQIVQYSPSVEISSAAAVGGFDYDLDVDAGPVLLPDG